MLDDEILDVPARSRRSASTRSMVGTEMDAVPEWFDIGGSTQ